MYISYSASNARQREAQKARDNRAEIVKARSLGEISRRDLIRWGIFTTAGTLALKNGLSPFATSAYADVPTGTPRSPLRGVGKFTEPMNRLYLQTPHKMTRSVEGHALFPDYMGERPAKRLSYHSDFTANPSNPDFINSLTGRGPIEGRPPGEIFAHQRWDEYFPKAGYVMTLSDMSTTCRFHSQIPQQDGG
jgi:hypothetical protein